MTPTRAVSSASKARQTSTSASCAEKSSEFIFSTRSIVTSHTAPCLSTRMPAIRLLLGPLVPCPARQYLNIDLSMPEGRRLADTGDKDGSHDLVSLFRRLRSSVFK